MSVDMDDRFRVDKNEKRNCPSKKNIFLLTLNFIDKYSIFKEFLKQYN